MVKVLGKDAKATQKEKTQGGGAVQNTAEQMLMKTRDYEDLIRQVLDLSITKSKKKKRMIIDRGVFRFEGCSSTEEWFELLADYFDRYSDSSDEESDEKSDHEEDHDDKKHKVSN